MLHRLIYSSTASENLRFKDLVSIRDRAQQLNEQCCVTGFLVYGFGRFLQVLEGERNVVSKIFNRIYADKRHGQIRLIDFSEVRDREFADWNMNLLAIGETNRDQIQKTLAMLGCPIDLDTSLMTAAQCSLFLSSVSRSNSAVLAD